MSHVVHGENKTTRVTYYSDGVQKLIFGSILGGVTLALWADVIFK